MLNLLEVSVTDREMVDDMVKEGECNSIEDLDPELLQEYDYAQTALIDEDRKYIIYWNDNMHGHPEDFINGFTSALEHLDIEYSIEKEVMLDYELEEYSGAKY